MVYLTSGTPRPWLVERHDQDDGSINYEIWCQMAPTYHRVVTIGDDDNEAARTDAALIIKAVNLHDELIEAMRGVLKEADRRTDAFDRAHAVLAKADAA